MLLRKKSIKKVEIKGKKVDPIAELTQEAERLLKYGTRKEGFRGVLFYIYKDPEDELGNPPDRKKLENLAAKENNEYSVIKNSNSACFAQFTYGSAHRGGDFLKDRDRVTYFLPDNVLKAFDNKEKDVARFLEGAISAKILPDYVDANEAANKLGLTIRLDQKKPKLSPSLLFTYLSLFRDLDEYTKVALLTLKAMDEFGMDFLTAYMIAHRLNHTMGHSPFEFSNYRSTTGKIQLRYLMGLRRYLSNPNKYDKRSVEITKNGRSFKASDTIAGAFETNLEVDMHHALDPEFVGLLDDEKAMEKDFARFT